MVKRFIWWKYGKLMLTNFLNYFTYNVGLLQKYKTLGLIGFKSLKSCTILSWETYSYISGFGFKFILFKSIQELLFIHLSNTLLDTAVLFCSIMHWVASGLFKVFHKENFCAVLQFFLLLEPSEHIICFIWICRVWLIIYFLPQTCSFSLHWESLAH